MAHSHTLRFDTASSFGVRGLALIWSPLFVFAVAFGVRLVLVLATHSYRDIELSEVVRVARSLAEHGTFAYAFGPKTGPTAHVSPAYPIVLSLIFRVLGTGPTGELGQAVLGAVISSLAYATLPLLSSAAALGAEIGGVAGLIGAVLPINYWSETKGSFEGPLAGLCLLLFCAAMSVCWRSRDFSIRAALVTGFVSGVALLTSPSLMPPIATALVVGFMLHIKNCAKEYGVYISIVLLCSVVCLTPWAIRNRIVFGTPLWSRSGLGIELSISNADRAAANMYDNMHTGWFQSSHPFSSEVERRKLIQVGEIAYNHERMRQAIQWIRGHPSHFFYLTFQRTYYFWFPRMNRITQRVITVLLAIGGFAGGIQLVRAGNASGWLFLSSLVSYSFVYCFVQSFARYRMPIHWLLVFLTTFAAWSLAPGKSQTDKQMNAFRL